MDLKAPFFPPDLHPARHLAYIPPMDLADGVKGMYRVLDLISESGSNGYVDKVVIAQDSLQRFINAISPGAYTSITKVDFKTLDRLSIKPMGIYGSKDEIVRLLQSIGAVDTKLARLLLAPGDINGAQLSSGLYIVTATEADPTDERYYVIYWPENSTWDDSAPPSVCRNRVAFMRYLTKMCDQVVALLSADHSASIAWNDEDDDTNSASDSERLVTFEVAKKIEQEETAVSRPGFQINSRFIVPYEASPYCSIDPSFFVPRILPGETAQGLLIAVYTPPQIIKTETFDRRLYSQEALSQLLKRYALILSEGLDEEAVQTLVHEVLLDLFPRQCKEWHVRKQYIHEIFKQERREKKSAIARDLADLVDSSQHALREEVIEHVISIFPSLDRDGLSSSVGGMESSMRLSNVRAQYPTIENIIEKHIQDAIFDYVPTMCWDFKVLKFGLISLSQLLDENKHLSRETRSRLFQTFVVEPNFRQALELLPKEFNIPTRWVSSFWSEEEFNEESFKKEMRKTVALVSDPQFLQQIESTSDEDLLSVVQVAKALAQTERRPRSTRC